MHTQELRSLELYRDLIRRGLPEGYAQRITDELHDHHSDLVAELSKSDGTNQGDLEQKAESRLGRPASLAKHIARDYRRRSWCGRWPLISFVLLPLPLLFVGWIATYLGIAAITIACETMELERLSVFAQRIAFNTAFFVVLIAVPSIIAFLWGRIALKTTGSRFIVVVTCLLLAIAASGIWYEYHVSEIPGKSYFWMGSPLFTPANSWLDIHPLGSHQLCQLLAPLAVGAMLIAGNTRQRQRALQAEPRSA